MNTPEAMAQLSQQVDALETLTESEFFTIATGSPQALSNLLARLARVQATIEVAALAR